MLNQLYAGLVSVFNRTICKHSLINHFLNTGADIGVEELIVTVRKNAIGKKNVNNIEIWINPKACAGKACMPKRGG